MHHNGANSCLFVNGTKISKFKAKDSGINVISLCPGNISTEFSVDDMKKTGFYGYIYHFSVDYDATTVDDILDMLFTAMVLFSYNALNAIPLKCVSMNNKKCKIGPEILNINRNEPSFYLYSILVNKCSGSCDNINNPYAKL